MGEYLKVNQQDIKLGTCEDLYYVRLESLQEIEALSIAERIDGNLSISEYLNPENGFRYRFPFPEEDEIHPGEYEKYDKGFAITIDAFTAPKLYGFLRGREWEHNTLCHSASVNGAYNINIMIPCPLSKDFPDNVKMSYNGASTVVEIVQQKQVEGQTWTVIRCGYCKAAVRLEVDAAFELVNTLTKAADDYDRSYREHNGSQATYYREVAARIALGYCR